MEKSLDTFGNGMPDAWRQAGLTIVVSSELRRHRPRAMLWTEHSLLMPWLGIYMWIHWFVPGYMPNKNTYSHWIEHVFGYIEQHALDSYRCKLCIFVSIYVCVWLKIKFSCHFCGEIHKNNRNDKSVKYMNFWICCFHEMPSAVFPYLCRFSKLQWFYGTLLIKRNMIFSIEEFYANLVRHLSP
jgi:hypothetical protein